MPHPTSTKLSEEHLKEILNDLGPEAHYEDAMRSMYEVQVSSFLEWCKISPENASFERFKNELQEANRAALRFNDDGSKIISRSDVLNRIERELSSKSDILIPTLVKYHHQMINLFGVGKPIHFYFDDIRKFTGEGRIVEVGAGNGYFSERLRRIGITVTAYDAEIGEFKGAWKKQWGVVVKGDHRVLAEPEHREDVLLIVAPGPGSPIVIESLSHFMGNKFIFVPHDFDNCLSDEDIASLDMVKKELLENWTLLGLYENHPDDPEYKMYPEFYIRKV